MKLVSYLIVLFVDILFHESRIRSRTSYRPVPMPFIWCDIMSKHWPMNIWTLFFAWQVANLCFFILEFLCGCCLILHLLSFLWLKYVDHDMPTIVYQATSQISTSCIVINFHFLIPCFLCNLLGISKVRAFLSSNDQFQNSFQLMDVFSRGKYWQQFKWQQTFTFTLHIDSSFKSLSLFHVILWASKSFRFLFRKQYCLFYTLVIPSSSSFDAFCSL